MRVSLRRLWVMYLFHPAWNIDLNNKKDMAVCRSVGAQYVVLNRFLQSLGPYDYFFIKMFLSDITRT